MGNADGWFGRQPRAKLTQKSHEKCELQMGGFFFGDVSVWTKWAIERSIRAITLHRIQTIDWTGFISARYTTHSQSIGRVPAGKKTSARTGITR